MVYTSLLAAAFLLMLLTAEAARLPLNSGKNLQNGKALQEKKLGKYAKYLMYIKSTHKEKSKDNKHLFIVEHDDSETEEQEDSRLYGSSLYTSSDDVINYVVHGEFLAFSDAYKTEDSRKPAIESILISSLASDKKMLTGYDAQSWISNFNSILGHLGWVTSSEDTLHDAGYKVDQSLTYLDNLANIAAQEVSKKVHGDKFTEQIQTLFKSLTEEGASGKQLNMFTAAHRKPRRNMFLFNIMDIDNESKSMLSVAIQVDVDLSSPSTLLSTSKDFSTEIATSLFVLNEGLWDQVQSSVEKKLGDHVKTDVMQI